MPLLRALRPQEWIKNVLVFAGLLFSGKVDEIVAGAATPRSPSSPSARSRAPATCSTTSTTRLTTAVHPEKRHRPIASGALAAATAAGAAAVLAVAGVLVALLGVSAEVAGFVALYGVITTAYSFVLKRS